jgi:hypothetical protein
MKKVFSVRIFFFYQTLQTLGGVLWNRNDSDFGKDSDNFQHILSTTKFFLQNLACSMLEAALSLENLATNILIFDFNLETVSGSGLVIFSEKSLYSVHSSRQCLTIITVWQDKENMDPEVIKQTVSELQQSSLKVTEKNEFIIFRYSKRMLNL